MLDDIDFLAGYIHLGRCYYHINKRYISYFGITRRRLWLGGKLENACCSETFLYDTLNTYPAFSFKERGYLSPPASPTLAFSCCHQKEFRCVKLGTVAIKTRSLLTEICNACSRTANIESINEWANKRVTMATKLGC